MPEPLRGAPAGVTLSPVGARRVEGTVARMTAVFGVLFSALTLPLVAEGWRWTGSGPGIALLVAVYGVVLLAGTAALLHQWARGVFATAAVVYVLALLVWPASVVAPLPPDQVPWIVALAGVPCGFVVVAGRTVLPLAYAVLVAALVTDVRLSPAGGGVTLPGALRDGGTVLMLAVGIWLVVTAVRRAAGSVDRAQGAALGRYADAQIDEATESERVRTDALVHDSVLTTFLSAAAASTPEAQELAARMAQNAMNVLSRATVASHTGPKVAARDLLHRIRIDAAGLGDRFQVQMLDVRDHFLPESVADAVVSATVQAMSNSVKHAGGPDVPRTLVLRGTDAGGVRVSIADRGKGFDPAAVASERLGLRVSILERMRRVGGEVDVRTAPGRGTEFVLSWPASARQAPAVALDDEAVPA